jgi:hypothetical protein
MFTAQVISSNVTINDFDVIGTLSFIPGAQIVFAIRLQQIQRPDLLRYIPPSTALLSVTFQNIDGSQLTKTMTSLTDDRSIWTGTLLSTDTANLASGNCVLSLDLLGDGSNIDKGYIQAALTLIITDIC